MARIAVGQMTSSVHVADNLEIAKNLIMEARETGASLIVLPENFAFMAKKETDKYHIAEHFGQGVIQDTISQWAKRYSIWILAGTIPLKGSGKQVRSASLIYDDKGHCVARYDKIHLFDVKVSEQESHQESLTVERGTQIVVVDSPVGKIGMSVCYDLRFPELYQQLILRGAEIITVPSAFTAVTGALHWEVLLKARAIENLIYVIAANQSGQHENGRRTYGHSMIIEPWGKTLAEKKDGSGLISADIDLEWQKKIRTQFPSIDHHVLDCYRIR